MQPEKNSYLNVYISIRLFRPLYIFFLGVDPLLYLCNTDLWRVQGREIVLYKSLYLFVLLYGCTVDICKKRERDSYRGVYRFKTLSSSTVRPRSSDPFYVVTYYIKCVTTSWTYSRRMIKLGIRSLYILKANRKVGELLYWNKSDIDMVILAWTWTIYPSSVIYLLLCPESTIYVSIQLLLFYNTKPLGPPSTMTVSCEENSIILV